LHYESNSNSFINFWIKLCLVKNFKVELNSVIYSLFFWLQFRYGLKSQETNGIVALKNGKSKCAHFSFIYKHYSHFSDHRALQAWVKIAKWPKYYEILDDHFQLSCLLTKCKKFIISKYSHWDILLQSALPCFSIDPNKTSNINIY